VGVVKLHAMPLSLRLIVDPVSSSTIQTMLLFQQSFEPLLFSSALFAHSLAFVSS
jgi:hypothetical protein